MVDKVIGILITLMVMVAPAAAELEFSGFWSARAWSDSGPDSWLAGGLGKTPGGGAEEDSGAMQLHLGLDWQPRPWFRAHLHGLARAEPDSYRTDNGGITAAWIEFSSGETNRLRLKAGLFFPPTSMEHVDPLWTTPYSQSFSVINSWIGEEVRPLGLDLSWSRDLGQATVFAAAGPFWGNDAAGALLAWRGWAGGDHIVVYDEVLPLPLLASLVGDGAFADQRDDGTLPLGKDLDGDAGISARLGIDHPAFLAQLSWWDNRGDRQLYRGEYAWETEFLTLGIELPIDETYSLIGEFMTGETGMGSGPLVQVDFESWYLLLNGRWGIWEAGLRGEHFEKQDIDRKLQPINVDLNQEDGRIITLSLFVRPFSWWRLGLEYQDLEAEKGAILTSGLQLVPDSRVLALESRISF